MTNNADSAVSDDQQPQHAEGNRKKQDKARSKTALLA
jgi:hypothetical protein